MSVVVVIPAYNEEKTVGDVIYAVTKSLTPMTWSRIIVVDDGSTDRTAQVARDAGALVLQHPINRGLGAALSTGIAAALASLRGGAPPLSDAVIVTLDADLQHDPGEIARVIEPILKGGADVVIGSRFHNKSLALTELSKLSFDRSQMPRIRRFANLCGNVVTWLLFGIWVSDSQSGFRAFSSDAAARLRLRTSTMEVSSEIIREIARLKLKMVEVPITVRYSAYSLSKGQGWWRGLETFWKLVVLRFFR